MLGGGFLFYLKRLFRCTKRGHSNSVIQDGMYGTLETKYREVEMKIAQTLALTAALIAVVGCSRQPNQPESIDQQALVVDQDILLVGAGPSDSRFDRYAVTIRWGKTGTETLTWAIPASGMTQLSEVEGSVRLKSVFSFEAQEDQMMQSFNPTELNWISQTQHDVDGVDLTVNVRNDLPIDSIPTFSYAASCFLWFPIEVERLKLFDTTLTVSGAEGFTITIKSRKIITNPVTPLTAVKVD